MIGDMITREEIRRTMCPRHGEFCGITYGGAACRARIEKAILVKHNNRVRENRRRRSSCEACREGRYHVHFG